MKLSILYINLNLVFKMLYLAQYETCFFLIVVLFYIIKKCLLCNLLWFEVRNL